MLKAAQIRLLKNEDCPDALSVLSFCVLNARHYQVQVPDGVRVRYERIKV